MNMRRLILSLLIIFVLSAPVYAGMAEDEWTGNDKNMHLGIGAVIGAVVTSHCMINGHVVWWKSVLAGTSTATFVGLIKEISDSGRTGFSYKDLTWTAGGGAVGSLGAVAFWTFDGRFDNWKFMEAQ